MNAFRKHATECRPFSVSGKATSASRARSRVATGLGVVEETKKKLGSGRLTPIYGVNSFVPHLRDGLLPRLQKSRLRSMITCSNLDEVPRQSRQA